MLNVDGSFECDYNVLNLLIFANFIFEGKKRMTNRARLWYVPISLSEHQVIRSVPQMEYKDEEHKAEGKASYDQQKEERKHASNRTIQKQRSISVSDSPGMLWQIIFIFNFV